MTYRTGLRLGLRLIGAFMALSSVPYLVVDIASVAWNVVGEVSRQLRAGGSVLGATWAELNSFSHSSLPSLLACFAVGVLLLLRAEWVLRLLLRMMPAHCGECGGALAERTAARCPECGAQRERGAKEEARPSEGD